MSGRNGMRGKGNIRQRRRVQNIVQKSNKQQHKLDYRGIISYGRSDPNRVLLNPWNTITLSTIIVGNETPLNKCLTVLDLHNMFIKQTGITALSNVYRIQMVQCWHIIPNGELNNRIRVRFYSLISETASCDLVKVLANVEDFGTPARNATAKFIWPKTHQSNVFSFSSTATVLRLALEQSQQVLLHLQILWKPIGASSTIWRMMQTGESIIERDKMSELHNSEVNDDFEKLSI